VLPELTVQAHAAGGKAAVAVRDAGDPVAGAAIVIGGRRVRANANGQAAVSLRPGSYTAHASAPGYAAATARVTVR